MLAAVAVALGQAQRRELAAVAVQQMEQLGIIHQFQRLRQQILVLALADKQAAVAEVFH